MRFIGIEMKPSGSNCENHFGRTPVYPLEF